MCFKQQLGTLIIAVSFSTITEAALISFNPGDLSNFTLNGDAGSAYSIAPAIGVGNGSGLNTSSTSVSISSAIYNTGINNNAGTVMSTSIMYKAAAQTNGPDVRLGFTGSLSGTFPSSTGSPFIWAESFNDLSKITAAREGDGVTGSSSLLYLNQDDFTVAEGNWIRISMVLNNVNGTGLYTGSVSFDDFGASGTSLVSSLATNNINFTSTALSDMEFLYAGFALSDTDALFGVTESFDNFSVEVSAVPVPAAAWLFGSGLIGLIGFAKRKKA